MVCSPRAPDRAVRCVTAASGVNEFHQPGRLVEAIAVVTLSQTRPQPPDAVAAKHWLPIVVAAVGLGLLADGLFNGVALGVNFALWVAALIGAFVFVARRGGRPERATRG